MKIERDQWVWVVVQDPGKDEQMLGQYDSEQNISFIPTFIDKETGQECLGYLVRDEGKKYELQAILYAELERHSEGNGFMLYVLSESGEILEKIRP